MAQLLPTTHYYSKEADENRKGREDDQNHVKQGNNLMNAKT